MTRVVFCADDLGMGAEVDAGIVRAVEAGVVREASLCVTAGGDEAALSRLAHLRDRVGLGLHLCMTFGRALTGAIPGLTDRSGRFVGLGSALAATALGRPSAELVERELRAQLARLAELGVEATHLNGHHHVHVLPVVRDAVLRVVSEQPGLHVRVPAATGRSPRAALLRQLGRAFERRASPSLGTLPCVGLSSPRGDTLAAFARLLGELDGRSVEWVVHPRAGAGGDDGGGPLGARAPSDELRVLESPAFRALLTRHGVEPSRFREV